MNGYTHTFTYTPIIYSIYRMSEEKKPSEYHFAATTSISLHLHHVRRENCIVTRRLEIFKTSISVILSYAVIIV